MFIGLICVDLTCSSSLLTADIDKDDCGRFKKVKKGDTGSIKSPNHPDNYPNKALCIWLLEAPINYKFEVTIAEMNGQAGAGVNDTCKDFVEVRQHTNEAHNTSI